MAIMFEWAKGGMGNEVGTDVGVSRKTVVEWTLVARRLIMEYFMEQGAVIGGAGQVVEINETLAARRKGNVGRAVRQQWLFGGIVRGSRPSEMFRNSCLTGRVRLSRKI